jgi:hypothetical protein
MVEKTVYSYKDLEVRISADSNEEIMDLLNHTIHGAERGMQYSLRNIEQKIKAYRNSIRFVTLYKKNHVAGTIGSCYRISGQGQLRAHSTYLKYLSFQAPYQASTDIPRLKRKAAPAHEGDESFKKKVLEIFSKPYLLDLENVYEGDRHIMYAFIESMNERTKNLVNQAGYEYVRSFLTIAFSRFSPKSFPEVRKITAAEKPEMKNLLDNFYRDYSLYNSDHSLDDGNYYVLKEDDRIIAGAASYPTLHKIFHIPGVWGWILMKVLPRIPYYHRLFHPGEFRFIVFDSVYCEKGRERALEKLFESICAAEGFNTGLMWLDDRSDFYDKVRSLLNMGVLNRMLNAKPGLVFIRFINYDEKDKAVFYESPAYISGFDFS